MELFPPEEDLTPEEPFVPEPVRVPAPMPDPSGFAAETGQALLPTPSMELPEPPFGRDESPEPEVTLMPSTLMTPPEEPAAVEPPPPTESERKRGRGPLAGPGVPPAGGPGRRGLVVVPVQTLAEPSRDPSPDPAGARTDHPDHRRTAHAGRTWAGRTRVTETGTP